MRQFLAFVKKEFYHIIRDRRTLIFMFGLPVVQILLFGFALSNEVKNAEIAIYDQAQDDATQTLIDRMNASRYFTVVQTIGSDAQIEDVFRKGQAKMVVVFPQNFQNELLHTNAAQVQLVADATDTNTATTIINYASNIIRDYQDELLNNQKLPYSIQVETRMLYNPQLKSAFNFVPGVMAMVMMLLSALMTSVAIVKEKELGTMEILLVSPMRPFLVVLTKAIPYLVLSFVNVIIILLLSVFVLEMPINGSLPLLLFECILFILTSLALGLLISSATNSQQVAMFISLVGLMMPTIIFSGFMFPIENMPIPLQIVSNIIPAKWFYAIVKSVMIKGLGLFAVWKETLILVGMTVFLLGISVARFKVRLE
jgi:ABC-2 type transport system permease protein